MKSARGCRPTQADRLDVHVRQPRAGIGVEVFGALHAIVCPGQDDEEPVVAAKDLLPGHDVQRDAEHGRVEVAGENLVAIAVFHRIGGVEPQRHRDVHARRRLRSCLDASVALDVGAIQLRKRRRRKKAKDGHRAGDENRKSTELDVCHVCFSQCVSCASHRGKKTARPAIGGPSQKHTAMRRA